MLTVAASSTPSASFTFSPASPVTGQTVQFTDTSTGTPTSWQWNFGDGGTSASQNPAHTFATAGSYTVTLTATNASGSKATNLTVIVVPTLTASFTYSPASPAVGQAVQFTDTSSGSPTSWQWNFGDGTTSAIQNPTHSYATAATYTVTLTATNGSGSNTTTHTVNVVQTLTASFTYSPASPAVGQAVQFTDTSSGSPTSWQWNFGDGGTSASQNPAHTFATAGSYTVTLTVTNTSGSKTTNLTVTIVTALAASFTFTPASPTAGQAVQFTDTSTGSPTSWLWNFGDGTTSTAQNPSHVFTTAASYTVTLTVTNSSGSKNTNRTVTIVAGLTASFTFSPASPAAGQTVQFTDTSTGSPTSWQWDFGDQMSSTVQNPSHAYTAAGSYSVTLTIRAGSNLNSISRTIIVGQSVTASFSYSPASPVAGQAVQFTDTSTGSPTSWQWSFGDNGTSTSRNPNHTFSTAGSYTVTLTATNGSGSKSASQTVTVAPAASFTYSPSSPVAGQAVQFTDASTGNPTSWQWSFGDGATSTAQNPSHTFTVAAFYTVTLTVRGSGSNSASRTIDVLPSSTLAASFSFSPSSPNPGQSVQFTDASTGSPTSWQWSFGDGAISTAQNPSHSFAATGSYTVSLTVNNGSGSNATSRTITVIAPSTIIPSDRLIDWSSAGVPGGTAQYRAGGANARTLGATLSADKTGATNVSSQMQAAINSCSAGQYLLIPNGTYLLTANVYPKSGVTIRGESVTGTIIKISGAGGFGTTYVGTSPANNGSTGVTVTAGATRGSNVLTLATLTDPAGRTVAANQMVQLTQLTPSYCHAGTNNGWAPASYGIGYDESRLMSIMFMVKSVDTNAKTVTLDHYLPIDMTASPLMNFWSGIQMVQGVAFENFTYNAAASTKTQSIMMNNCDSCWAYGIYFHQMSNRSIWFQEATNCAFEHCMSDFGTHTGSNSEGLDFFENCCWCKVEDSIFHSAGYAMVFFSDWMGGCCGNVVAYNYQDGTNELPENGAPGTISMDDCHGPITMFTLWEGNIGEEWANDGYWGSGCYSTSFRNRWLGVPTGNMTYVDTAAIFLGRWADYYTVVGNVLGTPQGSSWSTQYSQVYQASGKSFQAPQIYKLGYPNMSGRDYNAQSSNPSPSANDLDTMVEATLIRHGNYDYVNNAVIWDPSISSQSIPASLYVPSAPSWWGSYAWPAIGPDVSGLSQPIPASARWAAFIAAGGYTSGNISLLF